MAKQQSASETSLRPTAHSPHRRVAYCLLAIATILALLHRRPTEPSPETTGDADHRAKRLSPERNRGAMVRWWLVPLLAVTVVFAAATLWLIGDLRTSRTAPTPRGGLYLLTEANEEYRDSFSADLEADIRPTGFEGLSALWLTVRFQRPAPRLQWHVVVSGQYQIPPGTPPEAYCIGRSQRLRGDIIACPVDDITGGSTNVQYRAGGLGAIDGDNVKAITDSFDGLDPSTSSVLEGRLARPEDTGLDAGEIRLFIYSNRHADVSVGWKRDLWCACACWCI
jgi:hypothetical protein